MLSTRLWKEAGAGQICPIQEMTGDGGGDAPQRLSDDGDGAARGGSGEPGSASGFSGPGIPDYPVSAAAPSATATTTSGQHQAQTDLHSPSQMHAQTHILYPMPTSYVYPLLVPPNGPGSAAAAAAQAAGEKRKRSTRACDYCKKKRTKCTGGNPCEICEAHKVECSYTVPIKKRGPMKKPSTPFILTTASTPLAISGSDDMAVDHPEQTPSDFVGTVGTPSAAESAIMDPSTIQQRLKTVESLLSGLMSQNINLKLPSRFSAAATEDAGGLEGEDTDSEEATAADEQRRQVLDELARTVESLNRPNPKKRKQPHVRPQSSGHTAIPRSAAVTTIPSSSAVAAASAILTVPVEEEPFNGFRGIALSLQRKMRPPADSCDGGLADGSDPRGRRATSQSSYSNESTNPDDPDGLLAHSLNNDNGEITLIEDPSSDTILFYGRTSTTTSSAWRQSPRFAQGIMSISLSFEAASRDAPSIDPPPCSTELLYHLVSLYFDHIHPYFPMVHHATFTRQLKARRTEHFSLLVNSMCALVTQHCRDLSRWGIRNPAELHGAFFERARVLLGRQFDWPHINNVQALLLLCMVGQGTNINASSYHYIGIAHRQAVEMGMHRNLDNLQHPQLDPALRESMRTTWFCLYVLDRYISVVEGRPMAINDEDWDTPFPASTSKDITNLGAHVTLCEVLGRIANLVNRPGPGRPQWLQTPHHQPRPQPPRTPAVDIKQTISEINSKLSIWYDNLPAHLALNPPRNSPWSFHHHIHAMYHTAIVLLHRLDVGRFDASCTASATRISHILSESLPPPLKDPLPLSSSLSTPEFVFVMPLVVYSALTSSTLFLDAIMGRSDDQRGSGLLSPTAEQSPSRSNLIRSLVAFERLRDTSLFASYYRQLILEVLRCHGIALEGLVDDPSGTQPQQQQQQHEAERDMMRCDDEDIDHRPPAPVAPQQAPAPIDDPVAQLRAAAKAAIAAARASQSAATMRAERHGITPATTPPASIHVPSGAAVPRSSHWRTGTTPDPMSFQRSNGSNNQPDVLNQQSSAMASPSNLKHRGIAAVDPLAAASFAERFVTAATTSSAAPVSNGDQQARTPSSQHRPTPPLMSANGVTLPPFFADSVFSDLLNPFVDYTIWQELGAVMGGGRKCGD